MPSDTLPVPTISPSALLERLAGGAPTALLDVREEGAAIPGADVTRLPAARVLARAAELARTLPDGVVVVCNRGLSARAVAATLRREGNPAVVLEGGMRGWIGLLRGVPVDVGVPGLTVHQIQRPGRGCLSYLLSAGRDALVVDPAPDPDWYLRLAAALDTRIVAVFDTHLHADHLSGARALARAAEAPLLLPRATLERGVAADRRIVPLDDGDTLTLGGVEATVLALPGHTTDMTGLLLGDAALVGGDSLFADGIARPDLQRGDPDGARAMARQLHATLHERILARGDELRLLPGHTHLGIPAGPIAPTLAEVRAQVPELALADPDAFADELLRAMPPRPANYEAVIAANAGERDADPELEQGGNACATR